MMDDENIDIDGEKEKQPEIALKNGLLGFL
jgi:hypothetical protein